MSNWLSPGGQEASPLSPPVHSALDSTRARAVLALLLLLLWVACGRAGPYDRTGAYVNFNRAGEQLAPGYLRQLNASLPPLATVPGRSLSFARRMLLARLFSVRPAAITGFRWGPALAPAGHPLAGTVWYTLWYDDEARSRRSALTLRVTARGRIVAVAER